MFNIYSSIFIFAALGAVFVVAPFVISWLIAPRNPSQRKSSTYECGEAPVGSAWIQYNVRYYIFALIFLIFDVEVIFLFPWAVTLRSLGVLGLIEMFIFLAILALGLVYAWKKGALEWL
ncbi:MAG TPA: NADH-quinone oxidoreductase subunit A [Elusimicrobia bacterium]|nr:MAG: NADH-quinone oxidoreductase subunit A [Elusimicrobia bacterium RIFOXYA12_FULL_49_49]OGS14888.1 MAG: NADH-quinone oxidoreductase subunit A [Elusimicrobia bacterium RIFOXYA2_FULL_47_53]OGS26481.1 MAG: NADH-quinone oxidoreductase subunit A [Elusimicrobia bacterium RIFOXYB12_FULL_50_12]OGS29856.1 MAG: NADH-quinone oxidoreductase subunit A [Elusimicrobia bacterium RIFOXYB2_FULL_46_23]HBU69006.1 NADH-quinone oxidoreductase subunit A [Elusimicrobiota bacterium]